MNGQIRITAIDNWIIIDEVEWQGEFFGYYGNDGLVKNLIGTYNDLRAKRLTALVSETLGADERLVDIQILKPDPCRIVDDVVIGWEWGIVKGSPEIRIAVSDDQDPEDVTMDAIQCIIDEATAQIDGAEEEDLMRAAFAVWDEEIQTAGSGDAAAEEAE
jgi:hypothetical protein